MSWGRYLVEKNEAEAPIGAQEDTMKKHIVLLLLGIFMASPALFAARGGRRGGSRHRTHRSAVAHRSRTASRHRARRSTRCATCPRDKRGKIKRSSSAKNEFMRQTGYPHGRPGYVVDHVVPLKRGGKDETGNMQWQTKADAKKKDRIEQ